MGKGDNARQMAAAPLRVEQPQPIHVEPIHVDAPIAGLDLKTALETAIIESKLSEQAETIKPVTLPFTLGGFKLNGKAKDYTNDDGSTTRKIALAVIQMGPFKFDASINMTSTVIKDGEHKGRTRREYACKFPNRGRAEGYKPLFETDNPRVERELAELRRQITADYRVWAKTLEVAPEKMEGRKHGEDSVVEID